MNIEVLEKEFNVSENAYLSLSNIQGKVSIQAVDDSVIKVHAEKIINSGDADNTLIELVQEEDGKVIIRTHYDHSGYRLFRRMVPCKVNYEVSVPRNCDLKVRGVSNTAHIDGISGFLDISTVSGDVKLNSLDGEIKFKSVSGDVQGENIDAPVKIETVSGDFNIKKSNFPSMRVKTVSGDLSFETLIGSGPYEFNSVSGDIKLEATQLTGVTFNSSSLSGNLRIPLSLSSSNHSRHHHKAEIMGGGVDIRHKSVSGDFNFDSSGGGEELKELPCPISDEIGQVSRTDILDSIGRGELSVDEAVGILEDSKAS